MNQDLQTAKALLKQENYTCVLCRGDDLFSSLHRGVKPLLDLLDSGNDLSGFSAADKVVGRATAFLYCLLGVSAVHACVISDGGAAVLKEHGIAFTCDQQVPGIRNRDNTGPCPMEHATQDITDPSRALTAIRETLAALQR